MPRASLAQACFAGGLFALGARARPDASTANEEFDIGAELTATCRESYATTATGIGSERFGLHNGVTSPSPGAEYYILRPEYIESVFYMWRLTHDPKYRQWGWDMVAVRAGERGVARIAGEGGGRGRPKISVR